MARPGMVRTRYVTVTVLSGPIMLCASTFRHISWIVDIIHEPSFVRCADIARLVGLVGRYYSKLQRVIVSPISVAVPQLRAERGCTA
jgi:hypothetical protein